MKVGFVFCKQIKTHKRHTLNPCAYLKSLFTTKCLHYWRRVTKFLCSDKKDILLRPWWLMIVLHLFVLIIFHIDWLIDQAGLWFTALLSCPRMQRKLAQILIHCHQLQLCYRPPWTAASKISIWLRPFVYCPVSPWDNVQRRSVHWLHSIYPILRLQKILLSQAFRLL